MKNQEYRYSERGSAIIWIFILITLMVALTFAATRGNRTGLSNMEKEKVDLVANEMISYAQSVRDAVRGLRAKGCADTAISFDSPRLGATYTNPSAPGDFSCNVFHGNGGGLTYYPPDSDWLTTAHTAQAHYGQWLFTPSSYVAGLGRYGTGAGACVDSNECWELIMGLPYINHNICTAINRKLGFGDANGEPPVDTGASFAQSGSIPFQGIYPVSGSEMGNATPAFYNGTIAGCIEGGANPPTGSYHFFTVVLVR